MRTIIAVGLLLLHLLTIGQSRWIEPVLENDNVSGHDLSDYYDHGFLLLGWYGNSYPSYCWLVKTDLNGNILWQKTFGEITSFLGFHGLDETSEGNVFISGTTTYFDIYRDPIVMKLNACGEKEWCKVFHTPGNYDYSLDVLANDNGGCVVLLNNIGPDSNYHGVRVALAELDENGELIWQQEYNSSDSSFKGETIFHILRTVDTGYLMTGSCDYEDPSHPGLFWTHPYFIKFNSAGNFEWEKVVGKETPSNGGAAWSTVINPDSTFFYASISHYYYAPSSSAPALLKMDFEGNVIGIYDVVSGYRDGALSFATFINDSTLAASAGWGNTDDSLWSYAVIIDTLGNLLNSKILVQDLYTSYLQVTYDGKLLYMSNTSQNSEFDVILTKLNQNMEDDTIYTIPFTYDSLCPYQIFSDTIVQDDCGLIVGIEEDQETWGPGDMGTGGHGEEGTLVIWPNPASEGLSVKCLGLSARTLCSLVIYDIFGRVALSLPPGGGRAGNGGWQVDVSALPPGIYIALAKDDGSVIGTAKFVVAR